MKKKTFGFTLIELLIVVAIIAILAAIAVPNFLEAQTRAKVSRAKADLRSLDTGIKAYQVDNNRPPREYNTGAPYNDPVVIPGQVTSGIIFPGDANCYGLSTPIAYITTAWLFDPFVNQGEAIDFDQQTFSYMNIYAREVLGANIFGNTDGASLADRYNAHKDYFGSWKLSSIGPDRDYFNNLTTPGTRTAAYGENLPYDPSNDTISQGNIMRGEGVGDANPPVRLGLLGPH